MRQIIPQQFRAGATFTALAHLPPHPANLWRLSAVIRGPSTIDLLADAVGVNHSFNVSAEDTAKWTPGVYWYVLRATQGDQVDEISEGRFVIEPDLTNVTGYDGRSHNEIVLDNLNAVIEKRATQDQQKYVINNRELWRTPLPELLLFKNQYQAKVNRERRRKAGNREFGRAVNMRF